MTAACITRKHMDELALQKHGRFVPPSTFCDWCRIDGIEPTRDPLTGRNLYPSDWYVERLARWQPGRNVNAARAARSERVAQQRTLATAGQKGQGAR
jgi:hypothetical protein